MSSPGQVTTAISNSVLRGVFPTSTCSAYLKNAWDKLMQANTHSRQLDMLSSKHTVPRRLASVAVPDYAGVELRSLLSILRFQRRL